MHPHFLTAATAAFIAAHHVSAQSLDEIIVGCADVDCPTRAGSSSPECNLVDDTFNAIGLARIPVENDELEGLSWVQGVAVSDSDNKQRIFHKNFYLGTPPNLDLSEVGACAVFFNAVSSRVAFGDDNDDISRTYGTCESAMSKDCVEAIIERANDLDYDGLDSNEACEKLAQEFDKNLDSECKSFAPGKSWSNITVKAISGSNAPEPITSRQNSSSDCWPITPKTYDLTLIETSNQTGDYLASTIAKNFFGITPILTVFHPLNSSNKVVSQVETQMTCMKTIELSVAQEGTESSTDEDKGNNGANLVVGRMMVLVTAAAVGVLLS